MGPRSCSRRIKRQGTDQAVSVECLDETRPVKRRVQSGSCVQVALTSYQPPERIHGTATVPRARTRTVLRRLP